jgi:ParB family transcriptional regulator, chromosome partitioning protein
MARRVTLDSLTGDVEDYPGADKPVFERLPIKHLVPTPLNKREDFGTEDELRALGESIRVRQLQAVLVVTRAAYLKIFREHEQYIAEHEAMTGEGVTHVLVNGECRYRASTLVELDRLDAIVRDSVAESRTAFLDALFSENIDRKNFNAIEEANAVEAMVAECGSAELAAERWRKSTGWISQRRALLKLCPELQALVISGELPASVGRSKRLTKLPHEEQVAEWEAIKAERAAPRPAEDEQPAASEQSSTAPAGAAAGDVDQDQADEDGGDAEAAEASTGEVPGPRVPTPKAVGSIFTRYRQAFGTEAVAKLVREQLDEDSTVELLTVAARGLSAEHLAKVAAELATLQAATRLPVA